jgi:hypothetical protein
MKGQSREGCWEDKGHSVCEQRCLIQEPNSQSVTVSTTTTEGWISNNYDFATLGQCKTIQRQQQKICPMNARSLRLNINSDARSQFARKGTRTRRWLQECAARCVTLLTKDPDAFVCNHRLCKELVNRHLNTLLWGEGSFLS